MYCCLDKMSQRGAGTRLHTHKLLGGFTKVASTVLAVYLPAWILDTIPLGKQQGSS